MIQFCTALAVSERQCYLVARFCLLSAHVTTCRTSIGDQLAWHDCAPMPFYYRNFTTHAFSVVVSLGHSHSNLSTLTLGSDVCAGDGLSGMSLVFVQLANCQIVHLSEPFHAVVLVRLGPYTVLS